MDPTTAFFMALAALILTVSNITVTIANHRNTAGRVVVEMNAALLVPGRGVQTTPEGTWGLRPYEGPRYGVELAQVVLQNPGRTGATVLGVELEIQGAQELVYRETPEAFELRDHGTVSATKDRKCRLDPFDQTTYLLDFWHVVDEVFQNEPTLRTINVRAATNVAGQNNPYNSAKHGWWTIPRHHVSLLPPYTRRSARSVILLELMRAAEDPAHNPYLDDLAGKLEHAIAPSSSGVEIGEALAALTREAPLYGEWKLFPFAMASLFIHKKLAYLGDRVHWSQPQAPDSQQAASTT